MFTAEIRFRTVTPEDIDAVESLMATWYKNGQLLEWQTALCDDSLRIFALLPRGDSLDAAHNNTYAAEEYQALADRGLAPHVTVIGPDPSSPGPCSCTTRSSLVLFTNYSTRESPARCGDCFDPVPLYELPHTHDHEHLNILQWADDYRACDTLQMHCTTGERFGERQVGQHDSPLSRNGRELAKNLSERTGLAVYYYLARGRGISLEQEQSRRCPSCGGAWLLDERWHGLFDFRCDACHVLSNIAFSLA